jgi:predicted KAP-like P-loop ATPase
MSSNHSMYVSDAPLSNPAWDRFNRLSFAQRIAETIRARMDPSSLVIAIYGAWGNGKTTVLNFIAKELRDFSDVIVLSFNPWRFPSERSMLRYFFTSLAQVLESTVTISIAEVGKTVTSYGELIQLLCSAADDVHAPPAATFPTTDLEEQKQKIAGILAENQKKVVILIDDIDRLDERALHALFRLVKLTADFENTVYVLAFDAEMVASVIGERFTPTADGRLEAGQNFLEKIVQVPLDLPAVPAEALRRFAFEAINEALNAARAEITDSEADQFIKQFHEGLEIRLKTPRMAKRLGNALAFSLAINKGEVNTVEMMLVEGVRIFYPSTYAVIKRSKEVLVGLSIASGVDHDREERVQRFWAAALEGLTAGEASALRQLLGTLFPRVVDRTRYGSDWENEWAKTRRVTAESYFDRYFSYAIPSMDLADEDTQAFVFNLETSGLDEAISSLNKLITRESVSGFIAKLSAARDHLSASAAEKLAIVLSRSGNLFPSSEGLLLFAQPFTQVAMLISDLLEPIPRNTRFDTAVRIAAEAEPIRLAIEAVKWMSSEKEAKIEGRKMSELEDEKLWKQLATRIETFALSQDASSFLSTPKEAASCLSVWEEYGNKANVRDYVTRAVKANPQSAISLIEGFLPVAAGAGSGHIEVTRSTYESVVKLIAGEVVLRALESATGESLQNPMRHFYSEFSRPTAITIAHQFACMHKAALAER